MHRRQFLATSAAASAALVAPRALRAAAAPARIPIGFLGVTYSHGPAKLDLALKSPDWEFIGACDPTPAGRAICEKAGAKMISQDELFARARVVAVESEIRDHAAHALLALRAGKHVHLEKPTAATLADARAVFALAREKNLLVQGGFMWRYHPGFRAIFEAARAGWLGDIYLVRGFVSNNLTADRRKEWAEFPGGSMFELGSHLIDASVRLLGKPKAITPFLARHSATADALRDNNLAVLDYDRARAVIFNTALQAGGAPQRSFEVLGTKGTATLTPIEPGKLTFDLTAAAGPYKKGAQEVPLPAYKRYVDDLIELAAVVRGEKKLTVPLEEEFLVAETVLRASGMA
ncbi:MAG: Gfo/Idh/MocA family oxidoreductase [Opitutaceae bacterium]|nr:Gfo/Idh/MocA family oxidoreductase [Opitutaceae bacterium]